MSGQSRAPTLRAKLAAVETEMKARLNEARATFIQSGDMGTSVEDAFRESIRKFLPWQLHVGHGEIIDSLDNRSRQTDVVIVSEDHPSTFVEGAPGLFFIEGVIAAGEVKATLTSQELKKALEASQQFKRLHVYEHGPMCMKTRDCDESDERSRWFLFAFESQLTLSNIESKIQQFIKEKKIETDSLADAVFVLDRGHIINSRKIVLGVENSGSPIGWRCESSNSVLWDLLSWLYSVVPRKPSPSTIWFSKYLSTPR